MVKRVSVNTSFKQAKIHGNVLHSTDREDEDM